MDFVHLNQNGDRLGSNLIRSILGIANRNNRYISQPNVAYYPLAMDRKEQWASITGNEMDIYLTTAELKIVIDRLASMFANGLWQHKDSNGKVIENSEFVKLLENPNVFQSRNEFLMQWFIQRCIYGNVFTYQLTGSALQKVPTALWNLSPSRMKIKRTGKIWTATTLEELIEQYLFSVDGVEANDVKFEPKEIIQFSLPNSDDPLLGVSPLNGLRMDISNLRAAKGYSNLILTKKGALGVWSSEQKDSIGTVKLDPKEQEKIEKQFFENYGIYDQQRSVMVSSVPLKFEPSSYPTKELMLFESVDQPKKAIIDMFGANEHMFSSGVSSKGSTFSNVEMGEKFCYQDTIMPISEDLAYGLTNRLNLPKGTYLELNYSHLPILQEDETKKSQAIERKARASSLLIESGFDPKDVNEIMGWTDIKPANKQPDQQ